MTANKVLELPVRGDTIEQPGIDPEAPDTETAALGALAQEERLVTAQTERTVDIMKVGGRILTREAIGGEGVLQNELTFKRVGDEVANDDGDIALVTSGAINRGLLAKGLKLRPMKGSEIPDLQRLSTIGWRYLQSDWAEAMRDREIAPLLFTRRELEDRLCEEEAMRVIKAFFTNKEVPLINENDAITHDEINFGSNDILAATLAASMQRSRLFGTVRLFLLTDVNGVYEREYSHLPGVFDPDSRIPVIRETDDYWHLAGGPKGDYSIGGMASKFEAADIAKKDGVDMWIYNPEDGSRHQAVSGELGTHFPAA